jgi:hypothetical protein
MRKILIIAVLAIFACSCASEPVLNKNEYVVIDTLNTCRNGFNHVLGYDVIIEFDSAYHYGFITGYGKLVEINPRKIELK